MHALSAAQIIDIYQTHGSMVYAGETISHLAHAWQCGQLAYFAEASPELQLACWLHDLGQVIHSLEGRSTPCGQDDHHEEVGAALIEHLWGPAVAEPVRLHVQAKRYLVTRHPNYLTKLSDESRRSLDLQGGLMSPAACLAFECSPHHKSSLLLRVWDEQAKHREWFAPSRRDALDQLRELMKSL